MPLTVRQLLKIFSLTASREALFHETAYLGATGLKSSLLQLSGLGPIQNSGQLLWSSLKFVLLI